VELYRIPRGAIGELTVVFRTQSDSLIRAINSFLQLWIDLESRYLVKYFKDNPVEYRAGDGKFIRGIQLEEGKDYTGDDVGEAISQYISNFDMLLKGYLTGKYSPDEVERRYAFALADGVGIL